MVVLAWQPFRQICSFLPLYGYGACLYYYPDIAAELMTEQNLSLGQVLSPHPVAGSSPDKSFHMSGIVACTGFHHQCSLEDRTYQFTSTTKQCQTHSEASEYQPLGGIPGEEDVAFMPSFRASQRHSIATAGIRILQPSSWDTPEQFHAGPTRYCSCMMGLTWP